MNKNHNKIKIISILIFFFIMSFTCKNIYLNKDNNKELNKEKINWDTGCISGIIYDGTAGRKATIAKTNILIYNQLDENWSKYINSEYLFNMTASDSSGHYIIPRLDPGLYIIKANAVSYHSLYFTFVDVIADSVSILDFDMTPEILTVEVPVQILQGTKTKKIKRDSTNCP